LRVCSAVFQTQDQARVSRNKRIGPYDSRFSSSIHWTSHILGSRGAKDRNSKYQPRQHQHMESMVLVNVPSYDDGEQNWSLDQLHLGAYD